MCVLIYTISSLCCWSLQLYNFFGFLMDHFRPDSSQSKKLKTHKINFKMSSDLIHTITTTPGLSLSLTGNLICHIFHESDVFQDVEWERYFCYKNIMVPDVYPGPHLTFPLTISNVTELVDSFKNKQVTTVVTSCNLCYFTDRISLFNCRSVFRNFMLAMCYSSWGKHGCFCVYCPTSVTCPPPNIKKSPSVVRTHIHTQTQAHTESCS